MLERLCINTSSNVDYFKKVIKKLNLLKNKMDRKSPNYKLFQDVSLISLFAGYICYLFTKYASAKIIGWYSDRDKIIESYDMVASNLFHLNHHSLCERDSIDSSLTKVIFGIPKEDEDGKPWYDEMTRLPDHIAGTISDWDILNNWSSKNKFVAILEDCMADNPYIIILKLSLEPKVFKCSRIGVFSK